MAPHKSLGQAMNGDVLERGDDGYEGARQGSVWNAVKPDRYPELIAVAGSADDVALVVRFAKAQAMTLAIRCGGHNWGAAHLRNDGILLDLSRLSDVSIDAQSSTAWVRPAVTGAELIEALRPHGMAFPAGHCPTVALGGYLLAGGMGWNPGVWGPAAHSVRSIEIVTADGESITADADENSDLYWAARGGGPAFPGVVTRFELDLHRLPPVIAATTYSYPLSEVGEIAHWLESVAPSLAPDVELHIMLGRSPDGCEPQLTLFAISWADTFERAVAVVEPLGWCPRIETATVRDVAAATTFESLYAIFDAACPAGSRYASDGVWSPGSLSDVLPVLARRIAAAPSATSLISSLVTSASSSEQASLEIPFRSRSGLFVLAYAIWTDPESDEANAAWTRETFEALPGGENGRYVGETNLSVPGRLEQSYDAETWQRLERIGLARDPQRRFHRPCAREV